jgi:NAD(P)-dependent dehydrogenase (short-subunit alcohol dehydrogenase family)
VSEVVGRRVLITAGAAGIGRAIAEAFVAGGANVAVCDIDAGAVAAFSAANSGVAASVVDVADVSALDAWLGQSLDALGGIDVLVNNAGIKGPTALVEDVTFDDWRECLAVCLDAQFVTASRVVPAMKAQSSGSIINLSSVAGLVGLGMRSPYAAAKWAVIGLTKSLAIELGPHNVRCNAICPGSVAGDRMDRVIAAESHLRGLSIEAITAEYAAGQSIKRFVDPAEVAALCVFLASDAASMITGQAIAVDGHTETYHL